ncbi:OmpA family protein [Kordia algicida OT-1]|uniref:Outer membrane protein, peptidoglycan-associated lipoprotein n=1 Tax=Kordia algicida OT-1 TaxID=391587 RepID=A9E211_9FLAO|nr:OmpA family protein [Kordia algicida]EDP95700.1 outer membrane protein, peptidoglycan-associated lipoprotein [Kordia algicida OT-1]
MTRTKYLIYTVVSLFVLVSYAQERKLDKADKKYDSYAFINAIEIYEEVAEEGYKSKELFEKLGNAYYYNADLINASKWYGELFKLEEEIAPEYYFRYAQALKAEKRYEESDKMMQEFNKLTGSDIRGTKFMNTRNYLDEIEEQSGRFRITNLGVNSKYSDFAPSFYLENNLVFSSARDTGVATRAKHKWNSRPFLDLYGAEVADNGSLSNVDKFSSKLNTKYHESTTVFTKDGNTMYFTRNNYYKGKYKKDRKGINKLKIFRATREGNRWTNIEELPFNSDLYSVAHPALSVDEKKLYFASDMPGTFGQSDLFVVDINDDGTFGEPKNLGKGINTEARENFPFVSQNNELYFSSDGHVGLGGLDIFVMRLDDEEQIIYNVGEPVNSSVDDFSFIINTKTKKGYFASNRDGGQGDDDIYSFLETKSIQWTCEQEIAGVVKDEKTNEIIAGSNVKLFDRDNNEIGNTYSDEQGNFRFSNILACDEVYFVRASKKDYNSAEALLPKQEDPGLREVTLLLEKEEVPFEIGDDLAVTLNIPIIYFDFDKSNIRPDAAAELAKVIAVMKKYPTLKIDVRSHTDSRGSDSYNMALSQRRNQSTRDYIISKGIDASRLTGRGYGETRHVNKCSNGVKCSEEEHQLNRRSEFIVVEK